MNSFSVRTTASLVIAAVISLGINTSQAQTGQRPKPYFKVTSILAKDGNDSSRMSSKKLIMVDLGYGRSASLEARSEGKQHGKEPNWEGWDGAKNHAGKLTASWYKKLTSLDQESFTATAHGHDGSGSVDIELHNGNSLYSVKMDGGFIGKELNDMVGGFLPEWVGKFSANTQGRLEAKKVDFYKDGEKHGWIVAFDVANFDVGYEQFDVPLPPIPMPPGVPPIQTKADFSENKILFTGQGVFDESKQEPFVGATGTLSGESRITITGKIDGGIVVVEGGGGGKVNVHGTAAVKSGKFRMKEVGIKVDEVKTTFEAKIRTPLDEYTIYKKTWDWPAEWKEKKTIPDEENVLFDPEQLNPKKM